MARGPAYPYINLEQAARLAVETYKYARRAPAPLDAVTKDAWGYSPTSSSGIKVATAMKYYGLIESGENNSVKLTDRGYRIAVDSPDSEERKKAIREAALAPRWYEYCWKTWGREMPPAMRQALIFDHGFIPTTVDGFLKDYKKTIEFSGLVNHSQTEAEGAKQDSSEESPIAEKDKEVESSQSGQRSWQFRSSRGSERSDAMRQDVFSMAEGPVSIEWPATLSQDSFNDLSDWLEILKRKIKRSVVKDENTASET